MDSSKSAPVKELPVGLDEAAEEEYASQSRLLKEFSSISSIDKAWAFKSESGRKAFVSQFETCPFGFSHFKTGIDAVCVTVAAGIGSQAFFSISQLNHLANKKRKFMLSCSISKESNDDVNFQWAPFPVEMTRVSVTVPSPSGSKLLVIRNPENESPTQFEIWGSSQLEKEFQIPQCTHGSVYADGWFEGISWNSDESLIAYVAEEPSPVKPSFDYQGYKQGATKDKEGTSWKGQGDWEEEWGEGYAGKRQPALFVINLNSGKVHAVKGIAKSLSVGQVVWAPPVEGTDQCLVFVGWFAEPRKLGIRFCFSRPCALYAVKVPFYKSEAAESDLKSMEELTTVNLTQSISSAFFPRFSKDGKFLVFVSGKASVDSGAHCATISLHRIDWPTDGMLYSSAKINDVIPVVDCAEDGQFPGLFCLGFLSKPWLSDGCTMILPSYWHSSQVILSVNVLSGEVLRISPADSGSSWNVLTLDGDNVLAVCSSPIDVPQIKYGCFGDKVTAAWHWLNVSSPIFRCPEQVMSLLSRLQFDILQIPMKDVSNRLTKGAAKSFEAIFVSSNVNNAPDPLIVVLHGGPHSISLSSYSKGSVGFGEEALQSLPGKIGSQDVNDVLTAIDYVIDKGLVNPSKITVFGGSHGGFLATHLIGQAPDKFVAAAVRNPVCNLSNMVGVTDIPDWCYVESYGTYGKTIFTEAPTAEHMTRFYDISPISHISKVKAPTIFFLGARDLRVPFSNGLQYARALKERGVETKIIMFPDDMHGIDGPQSEFESYINIGVWFKKYCK